MTTDTRITPTDAARLLLWADKMTAAAAELWPDMGRDMLKDLPWAALYHCQEGRAVYGVGRWHSYPALLVEGGAYVQMPGGELFIRQAPPVSLRVEVLA